MSGVGSTKRQAEILRAEWAKGDFLIPVKGSEVCVVGGSVEPKEGNGSSTSMSGR